MSPSNSTSTSAASVPESFFYPDPDDEVGVRLDKEIKDLQRKFEALVSSHKDWENMVANSTKKGAVMTPAAKEILVTRKVFGHKHTEYMVHFEERRVAQAIKDFEATKLPPSKADMDDDTECPICFEDIPLSERLGFGGEPSRRLCFHCGKERCAKCDKKYMDDGEDKSMQELFKRYPDLRERFEHDRARDTFEEFKKMCLENTRCMFCRQSAPKDEGESIAFLTERAQGGKVWAQCRLGQEFAAMNNWDAAEAWFRKAADANYTMAETHLGKLLFFGHVSSPNSPNRLEGLRLLKRAADKGEPFAQGCLGLYHFAQESEPNFEVDKRTDEAVRLLTLSASRDMRKCSEFRTLLACLFLSHKGKRSLLRNEAVLYWTQKAANLGDAEGQYQLSKQLLEKGIWLYRSPDVPGFSVVPVAYRWACRARDNEDEKERLAIREEVQAHIAYMEQNYLSSCANCGTGDTRQLLRCIKCKAASYCSKACQKAHWRAGHKVDCCDNKEKLNA